MCLIAFKKGRSFKESLISYGQTHLAVRQIQYSKTRGTNGGFDVFRQYPVWYTPYDLNYHVPQHLTISYDPQRCYQRCMYQTGGNYELCDRLCYGEIQV